MKTEKIDFSKTTNVDDLDYALKCVRGMQNLLESLDLSSDENCFFALSSIARHSIKELENLKPGIDYMDDFMRDQEENIIRLASLMVALINKGDYENAKKEALKVLA